MNLNFKHISANELVEMLQQQQINIVDIRDSVSYSAGRIKGAVAVDNNNVHQFIAKTDRKKPLIVCCYHGNSSQGAAQYFADEGFEQSFSLDGGFEQWKLLYPEWTE